LSAHSKKIGNAISLTRLLAKRIAISAPASSAIGSKLRRSSWLDYAESFLGGRKAINNLQGLPAPSKRRHVAPLSIAGNG
jgi:hypothetical protein